MIDEIGMGVILWMCDSEASFICVHENPIQGLFPPRTCQIINCISHEKYVYREVYKELRDQMLQETRKGTNVAGMFVHGRKDQVEHESFVFDI
jgi:hypothetical protein